MYKKLGHLRDSISGVDAEGDQDNLIPGSGRVFSREDKSMTGPYPFLSLSLIYCMRTTPTHKYSFRRSKRKFRHCVWFTVKQFMSKLRGKVSKTAKKKKNHFYFQKHCKCWCFSPSRVIPGYLGWMEEFQTFFTEKKDNNKKNHNQS